MEVDRLGRVILLNGPSSSGKTSVGRALQTVLEDPWFLFPVDALGAMRSAPHMGAKSDREVEELLRRTRMGYHRVVAALASVGNNVIMDYPLSETWRLDDLLGVLDGYRVVLVDVRCDPDELDRRERARADRPLGLARSQDVFSHGDRDIIVDTTRTSAHTCAVAITAQITALGPETAFDRLRGSRQ